VAHFRGSEKVLDAVTGMWLDNDMSTADTTYHTVRPARGSMTHGGYAFTFQRSDGSEVQNRSTFCKVTVQYVPGESNDMPLEEVAQHVTCPRCAESCAIVLARKAAEALA
jgi:hypothetical protein